MLVKIAMSAACSFCLLWTDWTAEGCREWGRGRGTSNGPQFGCKWSLNFYSHCVYRGNCARNRSLPPLVQMAAVCFVVAVRFVCFVFVSIFLFLCHFFCLPHVRVTLQVIGAAQCAATVPTPTGIGECLAIDSASETWMGQRILRWICIYIKLKGFIINRGILLSLFCIKINILSISFYWNNFNNILSDKNKQIKW